MAAVTFTTRANLVGGNPENISDVTDCLDKLQVGVNSVDKEQLSTANAQLLGMNNGTTVGRGKSIISASEARTDTAYGLLTTPDRVQGIVLPTDGLLAIGYQAEWGCSVALAGRASIFLGSNQLVSAVGNQATPDAFLGEAVSANTTYGNPLSTTPYGLVSGSVLSDYNGDATTGQAISAAAAGGICYVFAAAGTYTVSVQFKSTTSGTVTVLNRKLWVWTIGF